jgi:hypothetical protein
MWVYSPAPTQTQFGLSELDDSHQKRLQPPAARGWASGRRGWCRPLTAFFDRAEEHLKRSMGGNPFSGCGAFRCFLRTRLSFFNPYRCPDETLHVHP